MVKFHLYKGENSIKIVFVSHVGEALLKDVSCDISRVATVREKYSRTSMVRTPMGPSK